MDNAARNASIRSAYSRENYDLYCEQFRTDHAYAGLEPSTYERWVAFNETMDRIERDGTMHRILRNPMMADDYNAETGKCDGIKYWERDGYNAPTALYNAEDDYAD